MSSTADNASNSPLALTIVTRTFWPHSGPCELAVVDLASELHRQGHQVEVVTVRWQRNWPTNFQIRGVPVTRIARPGQAAWGSFRFQRQLIRTVTSRERTDGLIVFGLGDESLGRTKELSGVPIVVRLDYRQTPYPDWFQLRNRKVLQAINRATAVAVDSKLSAARLNSFGIDNDDIHTIPDGISPNDEVTRTTTAQVNSRMALSNAHPILSIDPGHPLVISGAPFDDDGGVLDLVEAWKYVVEQLPQAKLWLIGDGSHGAQVWKRICELELVYSVILPGYFDELQPLFQATDLYVHPLRTERACSFLTRAMNEGVCPVVVESDFSSPLVDGDVTGLVAPAGNPRALAEAITLGLENRDLRRRLGNAARLSIAKSHSIEEQAKKYVQLLTASHNCQDSSVEFPA